MYCQLTTIGEHKRRRLMRLFEDDKRLKRCLYKTASKYRMPSPGGYLYRKIIDYKGDRHSDKFIELVYITLTAWNMNTRKAKLAKYEVFAKSLKSPKTKKLISGLYKERLRLLASNENIAQKLRKLFFSLKLVRTGNPPLVTFSKTLHFFLPHLIVPIDRQYTLKYFKKYVPVSKQDQFDLFLALEQEFSLVTKKVNLRKHLDNKLNLTIPKVCDNAIMGH